MTNQVNNSRPSSSNLASGSRRRPKKPQSNPYSAIRTNIIKDNISYKFHTICDAALFGDLEQLRNVLQEKFSNGILIIPELSLDITNKEVVEGFNIYLDTNQVKAQELRDFIQGQMREDVRLLAEEFAKPIN